MARQVTRRTSKGAKVGTQAKPVAAARGRAPGKPLPKPQPKPAAKPPRAAAAKTPAAKAAAAVRKAGSAAPKHAAKAATKATPRKRAAKPAPVLSSAAKLAIVERYIAAYNARDAAAILALYHPRATMEDPVGLAPVKGHAGIAGLYHMGFGMNLSVALDGPVRCTATAVAFPMAVTSPGSRLDVIDVFDLGPDGRIVRMRAYWGLDNLQGDLAVRQ